MIGVSLLMPASADAASGPYIRVTTVEHKAAYNGGDASIRPGAVRARENVVIVARYLTVFKSGRVFRRLTQNAVSLPVGSYRTITRATYRTFTVRQGRRVYRNGFHFKGPLRPLTISNGGIRHVINGSGDHNTSTFSIPRNQWKIAYTFDCSNFGAAGNFIVEVDRPNGDFVDAPVNALARHGSGSTFEHASGRFFLQITSECEWQIVISA